MTTYNHEAYLAQAIESVLAQQTSFGVELVLGDDCSTDSTAAICREYAAKYPGRVRFVTGQRNVGWRANYRRTFEACRGKYVAYCDGDDWWSDPRKLQMQADLLESDPSCGMCYTRASNYYQNTGLTEPDHEEHFTDFDHLLCRLTIANCATLARRDLIARYYAEVRPDEHPEWLTDDAPMWLWFAACSRVRYLPAITAVHRRLPQSVSHNPGLSLVSFFNSLELPSVIFYPAAFPNHRLIAAPAQSHFQRELGVFVQLRDTGRILTDADGQGWVDILRHADRPDGVQNGELFVHKMLEILFFK